MINVNDLGGDTTTQHTDCMPRTPETKTENSKVKALRLKV